MRDKFDKNLRKIQGFSLKIPELSVFLKVLIGIIFVIISFLIWVILYGDHIAINETITKGAKYDFVIGESKEQVLGRIEKLYNEKSIDDFDLGFLLKFLPFKEAREIYPHFKNWSFIYLQPIKGASSSVKYKFIKEYYVEFDGNNIKWLAVDRLDKYPLNDKDIKIGMSKNDLIDYLGTIQFKIKINFFQQIGFSNSLCQFSGDQWSVGYSSNNGQDYAELRFKENKLVEIYRRRQLIEVM